MRFTWTLAALLLLSAATATAQSSGQYLRLQGHPQIGYIEIPADGLLDTPQMTVEAWVSVRDSRPGACSSIAGNGYLTGWWLGLCGTSMRSYFNGVGSVKTGGVIPDTPDVWVHIAAVTDQQRRRHYVDGVLVYESDETATLSTSPRPVLIGSDPDWNFPPVGGIDELRIWKVARTQEQIRQTMNLRYTADIQGSDLFASLEAWYRFEGNAMDSWRTHHGTIVGTGIGFGAGPHRPVKRRAVGR
ncbi:MAG TPA: LamG domain-containing protein [Thermoanaerobaculia bacterium]|nr:LamG domain-containing protein [Thermoanaerobaculia bacterium]